MMSRSELVKRVLAFADEYGMLPTGSRVLCALSGGADSMALLTCLLSVAEVRSLTVLAAHYNHRLRGAEAQRDEDFVADWCRKKGVPLFLGAGAVAEEAARTGRGIEETARKMRYAFLEETAEAVSASWIATAHNADDNAETVLLHLVRGAGLDGLVGIPPVRGNLIRPLLSCTRTEIEDYLAGEGVPRVEDSTNADPAYARNRIRREVLPVLRSINPAFVQTLSGNLPHLRADRDYLWQEGEGISRTAVPTPEGGLSLSASLLTAAPRPVAIRAVRQVLAELGRWQSSAVHLEGILALPPGKALSLPEGLTVQRDFDTLRFLPAPAENCPPFAPVFFQEPGQHFTEGGWAVSVTETICPPRPEQGRLLCHVQRHPFPLTLRPRRTGDRLRLPGRSTKPLKKWYIDEKIPRHLRDALPVLTWGETLLAAAGLGPEEAQLAQPGQPCLRLTFTPPEQQRKDRTHHA